MEVVNREQIISNTMEEVLHSSMIPYAEHVILDRALPRVEDGLKPVQRRILYSMYEQGMFPDKGFKKSARVVGDCLAKYHPHGDSSVYDAMVRLAQPYNMRMTLVEGQGNFGSIDGDPAAAMRYTEVKMQPLALELLRDIEKNTVRWNPNFDDSLKEPDILPGRYPNLLVNGATGIAVGLATNIPTHNLGEVIDGAIAYMHNPKITLDEMMKIVKGPDFPTGGYVICGSELKKAYQTGRGKISIRAKIHIEVGDGDRQSLVITEIPYQVNKAQLLKKIDDLCEEKKELFSGIQSVNDESDRKGMRAVIKLKKDADVQKILKNLYKMTNLETSFGINIVAIAEGKPQQLGLLDIYRYYVEYQRNVILKRTKYDLEKAKERAHILEGLIIAVTNIDEVIRIIKTSSDTANARQNLKKAFNITDRQANAILDLRLARLTKLEIDNLKDELKQLQALIKEYNAICDSKVKQMAVVETEMLQIKKKYHDDRRSVIVNDESEIIVAKSTDAVMVEDFIVGVNSKGRIRKIKPQTFKRICSDGEPSARDVFSFYVQAKSNQNIYAFTSHGNCYKIDMELLEESKGTLIEGVSFDMLFREIEQGEVPVAFFAVKGIEVPQGKLMFYTKNGAVKLTDWSEYTIQKSIYQAIKLKDDDRLIHVEEYKENSTMFFVTSSGMCLNAEMDKLPEQGRVAGGVKGIDLVDGDSVVLATQIKAESQCVVLGATNGNFKVVDLANISSLARARKGVKIFELGDRVNNEKVMFAKTMNVGDEMSLFIIDRMAIEYYTTTSYIVKDTRVSKGKPIKNIGAIQPEFCFNYARQTKN